MAKIKNRFVLIKKCIKRKGLLYFLANILMHFLSMLNILNFRQFEVPQICLYTYQLP